MEVVQVQDGMQVQPNCVYVIPPNADLAILHGNLQVLEPIAPRGLRRPIDFFFRHLAADQKEKAIGIILSGMGSDGTLGMIAIKEHWAWRWCKTPPRPSMTVCPAARSVRAWPITWPRRKSYPPS